ncbi:MAG: phage/plasmid primase, P4 family [Dehalococcoidia bacterium]|nr:phage/plasmid primase, P4 family [Dehalococcoidia bacterium]
MQSVYQLCFAPGEVVEIRAVGVHGSNRGWEGRVGPAGIVSGYFDRADDFARCAALLDAAGARGVYYTLNPVNPALIARASNRLKVPKSTSQDPDVVCIRWLPIDLDPRRPADISASEAEVAQARDTAKAIAAWMEGELGWPRAIRAFSGNGYHLLYRLQDLPNDAETHGLVMQAIAAIAARFPADAVDIDLKVVNPARIWKLYGTTGRKGDSTEERPHRKSYLFQDQPTALADVPTATIDLLKTLAALAPAPPAPPGAPQRPTGDPLPPGQPGAPTSTDPAPGARRMARRELGPIDMERYLTHYGVAYNVKADGAKARTLYRLDHCLFDPNHGSNQASIIVPDHGAILYQCFHNSCSDKKWRDARRMISGDKPIAQFCQGYDPNWQPPRDTGTGILRDMAPPAAAGQVVQRNGATPVPPPEEIDPREFYEKRGKRPVFVPWLLVQYLAAWLAPICHTSGTFWRYEGGVWRELSRHVIAQIAVRALKDQVQSAWIEAATKILAGLVNREEADWPDAPAMINVKNGMIDLVKREIVPHDPVWGSRVQLPVTYDPALAWPRWRQFMKDIFPEEPGGASKEYMLQQFMGYCFLRDARYQKALFLYGTGANGKSTVLDVLQAMVGAENTSSLTLSDLTQRFKSQYLQNKLVNMATETNTRDPLTTEVFKAVVDGSNITAERKYGEPYQYRPFAKWIVAMNEPPTVPDKSHGFGRRVLVLNFERRFEAHEIIPDMALRLIEEIDGVFNWALDGLYTILGEGRFRVPEQIEKDTEQLLTTLNPMLIFVKECCDLGMDPVTMRVPHVPTTDLWPAYTAWCHDGRNRPLGRNKFLDLIMMSFPHVTRGENDPPTDRRPAFHGIGLNTTGLAYRDRGRRYDETD